MVDRLSIRTFIQFIDGGLRSLSAGCVQAYSSLQPGQDKAVNVCRHVTDAVWLRSSGLELGGSTVGLFRTGLMGDCIEVWNIMEGEFEWILSE